MRVDQLGAGDMMRESDRTLTVLVGDALATITDHELLDGKAWTRFSGASGVGDRNVRAVLHNIVTDQATRLPRTPLVPRWVDGRLILPPADLLPRGYGLTRGTAQQWADLLRLAAQSGRLALSVGLAVAGLYVRPLARQSYVVHLVGESSAGKTTAQRVAASVFGDPTQVILPWAVTAQGPGAWLRTLECLTGFRNDIGASGTPPKTWESRILTWTEGAERDQSTRTGQHRAAPGSWHGCLFSTGNDGLVDRIANEAVAARVVEIEAPLTRDADHAKSIKRLTLETYGHGLAALLARGPTPPEFADLIDKAETDLEMPAGGPAQRLAEHIASGLAGARLLGELAGVDQLGTAALPAAREVLAELAAGLAERGARPGDRLIAAIADAMAVHPGEFPTRTGYEAAVSGIDRAIPREVAGWDLADDDLPGCGSADVAVLMRPLRAIAEAAGIEDHMVALRDLRKRGLLVPAADGRHLARVVKVAGKPRRVYVLAGVHPAEGEPAAPAPVPAPDPTPQDHHARGPVRTIADTPEPCERCGTPTRVRMDGRPRHGGNCRPPERPAEPPAPARDPKPRTPAPGPQRGIQRPEQAGSRQARPVELANLAAILEAGGITDPDPEALSEALDIWHQVTDWLMIESKSAGRVGMLAWHRLTAQHGSIPEAERTDLPMLASIKPLRGLDPRWLDPEQAPALDGPPVIGLDVNAQFTAGARGCELGTGLPEHQHAPEVTLDWLRRPGYGKLATAPDAPGPFATLAPGDWLTTPTLRYLAEDLGVTVELAEGWTWPTRRRWLDASAKFWLSARSTLLRRDDLPARYALTAVKLAPNAFYGGWLRSEKHNRTAALRPDWAHMLISRARVNALRGMAKAAGRPLGLVADTAYFLGAAATTGMEIPEDPDRDDYRKPGKFKTERNAPVTPPIIAAHAAGRTSKFRDAVNASDEVRKEST